MDARIVLVLIILPLIAAGLVAGGALFIKGEGLQLIAGNQINYYADPDSPEQKQLGKEVGVMMFFGALFCVVLWGSILLDNLS